MQQVVLWDESRDGDLAIFLGRLIHQKKVVDSLTVTDWTMGANNISYVSKAIIITTLPLW